MSTHAERYAQIAEILIRHGFGSLMSALGFERFHLRSSPRLNGSVANPDRLVLALEELGPTFIKLGQVLSTRPDIIPPEYISALARLQNGTAPVPTHIIRSLIEEELGAAPEVVFAKFSDTPVASASIGQAHAATLHDGTDVIVKVRKPGVVAQVQEDLEILQNLAVRASRTWTVLADFQVEAMVSAFAVTLRAELNYLVEGQNAERFASNFANDSSIHIPRIYWDTTTSRVLTMERIYGLKIDGAEVLAMPLAQRDQLATRATAAIAQMIFEDGFFHADPHPGNLFVESSGSIGLIDFGMVGELDERLRERLGALLFAFGKNDPGRIARALLKLSVSKSATNQELLLRDITRFMGQYRGRLLGEIKIASLITELLGILRTHRIQLPSEIAMLVKMILMAEGLGVRLNPDFNLGEVLKPYASRFALARLNPRKLPAMLKQIGFDAAEFGADLPELIESARRNLDEGPQVRLRTEELLPLVERAERMGNRLLAGMILAAFIRGIGDLATSDAQGLNTWKNKLLAGGLGALGATGGYLAWGARPGARQRRP